VVTASDDNTARVWDASTGEPITPPLKHNGNVTQAAFSPDGSKVITVCVWHGYHGQVRVWDLPQDLRPTRDLRLQAQLLAGRRIDPVAGATAADPQVLRGALPALRSKYPRDFAVSRREVLAWYESEAENAERAAAREEQWPNLLAHLGRLIEAEPGQWSLYVRRGDAHAGLREWQKAAADYARAIALGSDDPQLWMRQALAWLAAGDLGGYRKTCAAALERLGEAKDSEEMNMVAWICALGPNAVADFTRPVRLAEKAVASDPNDAGLINTLGALLYRAGRFDVAVQRLNESMALGGPEVGLYDSLFLAMAHERLGHAEEARQWLSKAAPLVRQTTLGFPWYSWVTPRLLFQEAEALARQARP
jgi:tetratricopeptide (TPR) repeat protein